MEVRACNCGPMKDEGEEPLFRGSRESLSEHGILSKTNELTAVCSNLEYYE